MQLVDGAVEFHLQEKQRYNIGVRCDDGTGWSSRQYISIFHEHDVISI